LKLSTITDHFSGSPEYLNEIGKELGAFASNSFSGFKGTWKTAEILLLETASPSHKVSWAGLINDYFYLEKNGL